ncbi:MAG TPA: hypothetical protein VHB98_08500 [Chloroflexota bacterium]|nr:hypothetical protein [Chloroflexota bacterium]
MRNTVFVVVATAAAGLALLLTGCGHPFIPASALRASPSSPATPHPVRAAGPLLGVDLYAATGYPLPVVTHDGALDMAYLHGTLGAQAVGLVWNLTTPAQNANTISASPRSLSPAAVAELTRLAQTAGMAVQYRPLIRVGPPAGWNHPARSWEGHIRPASPRAWFASLYHAELPYLRVAQRLHVTEFVVGTELLGIGASKWWPWFLERVASVYHGRVSYAAVMQQYFTQPRHLPPVTAMGLDAYPSVQLPSSATQRQVTVGWEKYLGKVPPALLRHTALDEVGIPALAGAYRRPADWNAPGHTDLQVQSRWFTAACTTAARYHMRAVYFYNINLSGDPAQVSAFPAFFAGKPGATAIHGCLKILRPGS